MPGIHGGTSKQISPGTRRAATLDQGIGSSRPGEVERRCPRCGGTNFYGLADGRLKCQACRARFTPHKRPEHLERQIRTELTSLFWRMVPATRAAVRVGLNRKTVQRHYRLLRQGLAALAESLGQTPGADWRVAGYFYGRWPAQAKGIRGDIPLFGLARRSGLVLVMVVPAQQDYRGLEIDSVHCVATAGRADDRETAEAFWSFSRSRLGRYQGGWKVNFPLFLHEMAFRFNCRARIDPPEALFNLLPQDPDE